MTTTFDLENGRFHGEPAVGDGEPADLFHIGGRALAHLHVYLNREDARAVVAALTGWLDPPPDPDPDGERYAYRLWSEVAGAPSDPALMPIGLTGDWAQYEIVGEFTEPPPPAWVRLVLNRRQTAASPARQFQAGDKVRALTDVQHVTGLDGSPIALPYVSAGTAGEVCWRDRDGDFKVQWPDFSGYARPSDLELVQP